MNKEMHDACQMIDAAVFSSDFLCDAGELRELKGYVESWENEIREQEQELAEAGLDESQTVEGFRPVIAEHGCQGCAFLGAGSHCGDDRPCIPKLRSDRRSVVFIPAGVVDQRFEVRGDHPILLRPDRVFSGDGALRRAVEYFKALGTAGYENLIVLPYSGKDGV